MYLFTGHRDHKIDGKDRIVVPNGYATAVESDGEGVLYLVPSDDGAFLEAYPADVFRGLAQQQVPPDVLVALLCFHAQQAVEKSLKAVLLAHGMVFPYTHDLAQLITRVKHAGLPWPDALDAAAELSVYAVGTRYPGTYGDVTTDDYTQAMAMARQVVAWAEDLIRGSAV